MSSNLSFSDTFYKTSIETVYNQDLETKYQKVEKKASEAMKSFAGLVDELIKLQQLSNGTKAKEQIKSLTAEINNSTVYLTKGITEHLNTLHQIINPNHTGEAETELTA